KSLGLAAGTPGLLASVACTEYCVSFYYIVYKR
ncbi:hypothetical protein JMJ77_0012528, partial [Colletotrichum scovillei]